MKNNDRMSEQRRECRIAQKAFCVHICLATCGLPADKNNRELIPGGVLFLDFNVDQDFGNCVDGLVVVDTAQLKANKRKRYIEESLVGRGAGTGTGIVFPVRAGDGWRLGGQRGAHQVEATPA